LSRRAFLAGAGAASAAALLDACTGGSTSVRRTATSLASLPSKLGDAAEKQRVLKTLGPEMMQRLYRGHMSGRGGDIILVPDGLNYVDGGISHSTSWPYTQDIPMMWYGPGHIRPGQHITRPVTAVDVAPTMAKLLGFKDFDAPDGHPMDEALVPGAPPPRLIVVYVWDAGGRYVLDLFPKNWPNLKAFASKGTWYENATGGSGPSNTAPIHGNFGTGAYPFRHGILDNLVRFSDGAIGDPWARGPQELLLPTFADHYASVVGNRAKTGLVGGLAWHLGMLGHGSQIQGNPKPVAVLRQSSYDTGAEGTGWGLPEVHQAFYEVPDYVNDLPPLSTYYPTAAKADGKDDGLWRGHKIASLNAGFETPARVPFQNRLTEEIIRREGFGHHELPDLLFLNNKLIDVIGHLFSASSPEEGDCVREQDANLPVVVDFLNRQVGRGKWVLLITADHGHSAALDVSGASPIKVQAFEHDLELEFDRPRSDKPVVRRTRPGWAFLEPSSLEQHGLTQSEVSDYVRGLTRTDVAVDPASVPGAKRDEDAFASAFPGEWLKELAGL
jgi:hypothetical protein